MTGNQPPVINIQNGPAGVNRFSAMFPFARGIGLGGAARAAQANPNPAAHPQVPQVTPATPQGVAQAQQKLAALFNACRKQANMAAPPPGAMPPPPPGAMPPPPPGGMPPPGPAGAAPPMDPMAMTGGGGMAPPMDPTAAGGMPPAPIDPNTGQPLAPPMGTPPAPPLPANPRPNPPRPQTSQDALREAVWLRLMESKQRDVPRSAGQATDTINDQLLALGKSAGAYAQSRSDDEFYRPSIVGSAMAAGLPSAMIGAPLGALLGFYRGNTPEGLGRGIVRGGLTGAGMGIGGTIGAGVGSLFRDPRHDALATLLGVGVGGLTGYLGSGRLLGKPVGRPDDEEKAANWKDVFQKSAVFGRHWRRLGPGLSAMPRAIPFDARGPVKARTVPNQIVPRNELFAQQALNPHLFRQAMDKAASWGALAQLLRRGLAYGAVGGVGYLGSRLGKKVIGPKLTPYVPRWQWLHDIQKSGMDKTAGIGGFLGGLGRSLGRGLGRSLGRLFRPAQRATWSRVSGTPRGVPRAQIVGPGGGPPLVQPLPVARPPVVQPLPVARPPVAQPLPVAEAAPAAPVAKLLPPPPPAQGPTRFKFYVPHSRPPKLNALGDPVAPIRDARLDLDKGTSIIIQQAVGQGATREQAIRLARQWAQRVAKSRPSLSTMRRGFPPPLPAALPGRPVVKASAQADTGGPPARSATGESEGLSFAHKDDDYAEGQAAWAATGRYFKGGSKLKSEPNPFIGKHAGAADTDPFADAFFARCEEAGLGEGEIRAGVEKIAAEFPEAAGELRAGLEKRAWRQQLASGLGKAWGGLGKAWGGLGKAWGGTKRFFGYADDVTNLGAQGARRVDKPAIDAMKQQMREFHQSTLPGGARYGIPRAEYSQQMQAIRQRAMAGNTYARGDYVPTPGQRFAGFIGRNRAGIGQSALGGIAGGIDADPNDPSNWRIGGFGFNPYNAVLGAAAFNPYFRGHSRQALSGWRGALSVPLNAYRYGIYGGLAGSGVDTAAGWAGLDTGGWGHSLGRGLGMATGFGSRLGQLGKFTLPAGSGLQRFSDKLWYGTKPVAKGIGSFERGVWSPVQTAFGGANKLFDKVRGVGRPLTEQAARLVGWGGAGLGGLYAGTQAIKNFVGGPIEERLTEAAARNYNDMVPVVAGDLAGIADSYLASRGMLNQSGQFDPSGQATQRLLQGADDMLASVGLDPTGMSGFQKIMALGSLLGVGGGLVGGAPAVAGAGGVGLLLSLLPLLARRNQPGGQAQQRGALAGTFAGPGGLPANAPQARDEFAHQLQLYNQ